jgi:hypothetical protein
LYIHNFKSSADARKACPHRSPEGEAFLRKLSEA